jgi:Nucleotidyl transferase AbiEii toxin, Type IV TA system
LNTGGELTIHISGVKVTFLHYPFPPLLPLLGTEPVPLLSTKEILASKAYTIGRRGEFKDYVDLYAGLRGNHSSLSEMIVLARKKYGDAFNDRLFLEQLVYLDDIPDYPIVFIGETIERSEIERFLRAAVSSFKRTT